MEEDLNTTKPSINWDHVHPDFNYLARDADGTATLFKEEPELGKSYWNIDFWMSEAQNESAMVISSLDKGTCHWRDSLIKRPEYQGDQMNNKDLLTDLCTLLKKHKIYLRTDEDEILIIDDDTNKPIQGFYYMIDTVELNYRLSDMEKDNETV